MNNLVPVAVCWSNTCVRLHLVPPGLSEEELTRHIFSLHAQEDAPAHMKASGEAVSVDEMIEALMAEYECFKNGTGSFSGINPQWIVSYNTVVGIDDMYEYLDLMSDVCEKNQWPLALS